MIAPDAATSASAGGVARALATAALFDDLDSFYELVDELRAEPGRQLAVIASAVCFAACCLSRLGDHDPAEPAELCATFAHAELRDWELR